MAKAPRLARVELYRGDGLWSYYVLDENGGTSEAGTMSGPEPKSKEDHVRRLDQDGNDWEKSSAEHMERITAELRKAAERLRRRAE